MNCCRMKEKNKQHVIRKQRQLRPIRKQKNEKAKHAPSSTVSRCPDNPLSDESSTESSLKTTAVSALRLI